MDMFEELFVKFGWKKRGTTTEGVVCYASPQPDEYVAFITAYPTGTTGWEIIKRELGALIQRDPGKEDKIAEGYRETLFQSSYFTLLDVLGSLADKHKWQQYQATVI